VADKKEKETNGEFKEVYRHISRKLYDKAAEDRGWGTQRRQADAVGFLLAFCRMASGNNRLKGRSGKYLFKRELGKQAKKDRHIRQADPDNKKYPVSFTVMDAWTPAGQLYYVLTADNITINGNVYQDWHIAPGFGSG